MDRRLRLVILRFCLFLLLITLFLIMLVPPRSAPFVVLVLSLGVQGLLFILVVGTELSSRRKREYDQAGK
jgi:Zn-dependent protease with chaperone function